MGTIKMKTSEAAEITRRAIGLAIVKNRDKIISLLKKYGVAVDKSYSDDQLIVATLVGIRSNAKFKNDLRDLLADTTSETVGFTAEYNSFFFTGKESFFNLVSYDSAASEQAVKGTTGSATKEKTALGSLLSDKNTLTNILNTGLNVFSTSLTNKGNKELADKALQIEVEKTKQATLAAQNNNAGGGSGVAGLSTGAKVAIGVGVLAVVGVIIYFVAKK